VVFNDSPACAICGNRPPISSPAPYMGTCSVSGWQFFSGAICGAKNIRMETIQEIKIPKIN